MEYGDKLKQRRLELGLTMQEVADIVGVSKPTIQRYESGIIDNMRKDKISLMAKALRVAPEFIIGIHQDTPHSVPDPNVVLHSKLNRLDPDDLKTIEATINTMLQAAKYEIAAGEKQPKRRFSPN